MKSLIFILCMVVLALMPGVVSASIEDLTIKTGCGDGTITSYTSALKMPVGLYDVYVRTGKANESYTASAYARMNSLHSRCQNLGSAQITGVAWTKLQTVEVSDLNEELIMQLQSPSLSSRPDANRPSFLLLPSNDPVCVPTDECRVTVGSETGYIRAFGSAPNQNSMLMVRAVDPAGDTLKRVRYYVDAQLVYVKETLETFDLRYVEHEGQVLTRVAEYTSGQQIVFQENAPENFVNTSITDFYFRLQQKSDGLIRSVLWIAVLTIFLAVIRFSLRRIEHHKQWLVSHGLKHEAWEQEAITAAGRKRLRIKATVEKVIHLLWVISLASLAVAGVVWGVSNFALLVTKIDGTSMINTYESGQTAFVNRLPVSLARLNHSQYVPRRGAVVIVTPRYGLLDETVVSSASRGTIIKRVLGLPGERVVIDGGKLTVYNKEHPEGFSPDEGSKWQESMIPEVTAGRLEVQLGVSELFIGGDNRPESIDSRFNGAVSVDDVIGEVFYVK